MPASLPPLFILFVALALVLFAGTAWYFLVRPVPEKIIAATITDRIFQPAEQVEKQIPRAARPLEDAPREIKYTLPDRYLFSLRLEDGTEVGYAAPAFGMEKAQAGQRVRVVYLERRIPFFGRRIWVKEMTLLDAEK